MYQSGDYECLSEQAAREATMAVLEVLDPETVVHRLTSDPHAGRAGRSLLDARPPRGQISSGKGNERAGPSPGFKTPEDRSRGKMRCTGTVHGERGGG